MTDQENQEDSSLRVALEQDGQVAVLRLAGELKTSSVIQFRRACTKAEKLNLKSYVVDLENLDSIDGYGLASLVGLKSRCRGKGSVVLSGVNPDLRKRFEDALCDSIFRIELTVLDGIKVLTSRGRA